ncbi:Ankyrin repeat domain-containing protein [Actinidia chinensis var. chinensis]|uniref:Ankyrin repeat domain-containing protein n=1 Tax=Actinidia chinensis var. chinensis TaxID=1590841 RepID=A0A2R6PSZ9_ACTCC|nr:Ankyrin repeat domain-containing protein [Actinidia chinensis var. chinensis]
MSETADMERRLYKASLSGSVLELEALSEEDQLILDRVSLTCFDDTPLHITVLGDHLNFTRTLLSRKPKLVTELDSMRCSPLHLASAESHVEIVRELLRVNFEVLGRRMIKMRRDCFALVSNTTLWSICGGNDMEFLLNSQDGNDNTILHLAAALGPLDVLDHRPTRLFMAIREFFSASQRAKSLRGSPPKTTNWFWNKYLKVDDAWLKEVCGHLVTAATLTATMAYQAVLSPPGGVWQDNITPNNGVGDGSFHVAGTSIPGTQSVVNLYPSCLFLNTASLITSLNTILLALSGFPFENKLFLWLMIFAMCSAIATMAGAYILTLEMVFPMLWSENLHVIVPLSLYVWIVVCAFVLVLLTSRFFVWMWNRCPNFVERWKRRCNVMRILAAYDRI